MKILSFFCAIVGALSLLTNIVHAVDELPKPQFLRALGGYDCRTSKDCSSHRWCDTKSHRCTRKRENGKQCNRDEKCLSGYCEHKMCVGDRDAPTCGGSGCGGGGGGKDRNDDYCSKDSHCGDDYYCWEGECWYLYHSCSKDNDCNRGFYCSRRSHKCRRQVTCHCSDDEYCDEGRCRAKNRCANVHCKRDEYCDDGHCYKKCGGGCKKDSDCGSGRCKKGWFWDYNCKCYDDRSSEYFGW